MPAKLIPTKKPLLTVSKAAKLLNISSKTLRRWDQKGIVKALRTKGGQRRYSKESLAEFLAGGTDRLVNNKSLSIAQAAEFLSISSKTLRRWDNNGLLKAKRTKGGQRRYTLEAIKNFTSDKEKAIRNIVEKFPKFPQSLPQIKFQTPDVPEPPKQKFSFVPAYAFAGLVFLLLPLTLLFTSAGRITKEKAAEKLAGAISPFLDIPSQQVEFPQVLGEEEKDIANKMENLPLFASADVPAYISPINTIANSSFEGGDFGASPRHWGYFSQSSVGNTTVSNESVRTGNLALKMEDQSVANPPAGGAVGQSPFVDFGISQPRINTINGRYYTLSIYVRSFNMVGSPTLRFGFMGGESAADDDFVDYLLSSANTSDWTRFTMSYFSKTDGNYPYIQILGYKGGRIFVDDVAVNEISTNNYYSYSTISNQLQDTSELFPPFSQNNITIADNTVVADSNSNIYPILGGQGNLGMPNYPFVSLYLVNASISDSGKISTEGDMEVKGNTSLIGTTTTHGELNVDGDFTVRGETTIEGLTINGNITGSLIPSTDDTYDIGSTTNEWRDAYFDGTLNTDAFRMPTGVVAGYALITDANGVGTWQNVGGGSGYWTLTGNNLYPDVVSYNVAIGAVDAGSAKLYVNGNVGVGTTNPTQKLHISGNMRLTGSFYDANNQTGTNGQVLSSTGTGTSWIDMSSGGGGDWIMAADFGTAQTIGTGNTASFVGDGVGIGTSVSATDTLTIYGLYTASNGLTLSTADFKLGGTLTELTKINQDSNDFGFYGTGNVGVGTTDPAQKFHVEGQCITGDSLLPIMVEENNSTYIENYKLKIKYSRIDEVKEGDYVYSLDEDTGKIVPAKIKGLLDMGVKSVYRLTTKTGKQIRTTGNHPYLTKDGWKKVIYLKKGVEIAVVKDKVLGGSMNIDKNSQEEDGNRNFSENNNQSVVDIQNYLLLTNNQPKQKNKIVSTTFKIIINTLPLSNGSLVQSKMIP